MMTVLSQMSSIIIPLIIVGVVGYGLMRRIKVYEVFLDGAKEGLKIVVDLVPTLIGLLMAVGILRASGLLEAIGQFIEPLASLVGLPGQIMPLLLIKMFSSSASTGLVLDIFKTYGPDSYIGFLASVLMSCTETIFYTMSVYFLAAKVTKTRYTLAGSLIATMAGTIASVVVTRVMM